MLESLRLKNVGPAPEMALDLAPRLNLITGDNGLGKSFLLDVAFWALTRRWPAEVNPALTSGQIARPRGSGPASIGFSFQASSTAARHTSTFDRESQAWSSSRGRPGNPGLVVYAQVDGGFSVWDPARNYWRTKAGEDAPARQPAYVFTARQVWEGLRRTSINTVVEEVQLCNGLLTDWALWQSEGGRAFGVLKETLLRMSPSENDRLEPGDLVKLSLDDSRRIPSLRTRYGLDVPVLMASAGVRRIIALAYLLVWAWEEHVAASALLDQPPTNQVTFLVDEIESHLHPRWQRTVVGALLGVVQTLAADASVQLICATHSPLVLASVEPIFDETRDAWFDLDLRDDETHQGVVELRRRPFVRRGDASHWLTSEAFDLATGGRSIVAERAITSAMTMLEEPAPSWVAIDRIDQALRDARLPDLDPF